MIIALRILFLVTLGSMLAVTSWASWQCPLFGVPREVATHPWFIATLFDAYWGFLTFYVWVAWREKTWIGRSSWAVAILLLGNIAMAAYCLEALFRVPTQATFGDVVLTTRTKASPLGPVLGLLGVAVVGAALL